MRVHIELLDNEKVWDELLASSPHATLFHNLTWLKVIGKYARAELLPVVGYKGETPIGVYPLFYQRSMARCVLSPPQNLCPYLGPALADYDKLKEDKRLSIFSELQACVDNFIFSELKANYALITLPAGFIDCRPLKWTGYQIKPAYYCLLDVAKFREGGINRDKINVEEEKSEVLSHLHSLFGWKVPPGCLLELSSAFKQNLKIFVARREDEIIGGAVYVCYKNRVTKWLEGHKDPHVGDVLLHRVMMWAYEHGFEHYEDASPNYELIKGDCLKIRFTAEKYSSFVSRVMLRVMGTGWR